MLLPLLLAAASLPQISFEKYQLPNGLTVILSEDHRAPVVGVDLWYHVGAVDERVVARERGFALAPTAFLCASIDHRALDGMDAGALLGAMKRVLERE